MAELHVERIHTEQVVLDIGGNIGALMIYTGKDWCGKEIELSPKGNDSQRVHNQVHERRFNGRVEYVAVYPDLQAGDYVVWRDGIGTLPGGSVTIVGGRVATLDWR